MLYLGQILFVFVSLIKVNDDALTIYFENIADNKGTLLVGIYTDQKGWKARKPTIEFVVPKTGWFNGQMTTKVGNLKDGVYGIAVLDDTNDNQIVDMGMLFPREGFGFSNYQHKTWFLPTFEDFDFSYPQSRTIKIRLTYLD